MLTVIQVLPILILASANALTLGLANSVRFATVPSSAPIALVATSITSHVNACLVLLIRCAGTMISLQGGIINVPTISVCHLVFVPIQPSIVPGSLMEQSSPTAGQHSVLALRVCVKLPLLLVELNVVTTSHAPSPMSAMGTASVQARKSNVTIATHFAALLIVLMASVS